MKMALDKLRNDIGYVPILKPELVDRAERVLSRFSMASDQYNRCLTKQIDYAHQDIYQTRLKTARLYVHDFLLVFSMSVNRGDYKAADRDYYMLTKEDGDVPDLTSEVSVLTWCQNAIKGEKARTARGGIPIYNPTIAKLTVHYDLFNELYQQKRTLCLMTEESLAKVAEMRREVDATILEMWNSIEKYYEELTGEAKLNACRQYGVVYYYRGNEKRPD